MKKANAFIIGLAVFTISSCELPFGIKLPWQKSDTESVSTSISNSESISAPSIDTYATIHSTNDSCIIYGYIGEGDFDLDTINVSNITQLKLSYSTNDDIIEIKNNKISFIKTGVTSIYAENDEASFEYIVVVNDSKENKYNYPIDLNLNNYSLKSGTSSNVSVNGKKVTLTSGSTWTRITYPIDERINKNYLFEADVTMSQANDNSRWLGLVFKNSESTKGYPYLQFDLRNNLSSSNGVEVTYVYNKDAYSYPYSSSVSGYGSLLNTTKHLAVSCNGFNGKIYIDNNLISEFILPINTGGDIGLQCSGSTVTFENIKVSYQSEKYDYKASVINSNADYSLSRVNASYIDPMKPSIIASGKDDDEIMGVGLNVSQAYFKAEYTNDGLKYYDCSDNLMTISLDYFLSWFLGAYVPHIEVNDKKTVDEIANIINSFGLSDYVIWSRETDVLAYAHKTLGADAKLGYVSYEKIESSADVSSICLKAGSNYATMVMVDYKYLDKDVVSAFVGRGYVCVARASDSIPGGVIQSAISGCTLILTNFTLQNQKEVEMLEDESIFIRDTKNQAYSLLYKPFSAGHRGAGTSGSNPEVVLPENTISSMEWAYDNGADAIEIDIHTTSDNKLVVIHDDTTEGLCTQNYTVSTSTLAKLQSLTIKNSTDHIPSFEEVLQHFQGDKYQDKTMILEIKDLSYKTAVATIEMSKKYGWYGRYTMITFDVTLAKKIREYDPSIQVGYLNTVDMKSAETYWQGVSSLYNQGISYAGNQHTITSYTIEQTNFHGQGLWGWTFDSSTNSMLIEKIICGLRGYTTNYLGQFKNNNYKLVADREISLEAGQSYTFTAKAVNYMGVETNMNDLSIIVISGNATCNNNTITRTGTGDIKVVLRCKSDWHIGKTSYIDTYLYSDVITIK